MAIDAGRLLAYDVPTIEQHYTLHHSALYALSIGMGRDPLDERRLDFVDPNRADRSRAVPSMALVLGYPGFWLTRPDTTVDPTRILHGTQAIRWHRVLPAAGHIVGRTRVLQVIDRGPGKHAMVLSERQIIDADTTVLLATLTQVHVLRGQGGFGGDDAPLPPPHPIPSEAPFWSVEVRTSPDQALLYRLNGDLFPLHADPAMARKSGFPRPILHGMCVAGIASQELMRVFVKDDPSRMRSIEMRFSAPVFPGETIRIDAWRDGSFRASCVERSEVVVDNGLLAFDV